MPLLTEGLCPQLSADHVSHLKCIGIRTVTEFVSTNIEDLSRKSKIPYKDLVCIRHNLLSDYGCFPQRADSLYALLLETMHIIDTGSKSINAFLKGGIYTGEVTELYGPPASGKTQLCLSIAANLVESKSSVLYLDSGCNFSAKRFEQILKKKCDEKEVVSEKMHKVKIVNVRDIYHLLDVLQYIKCELHNLEDSFFKHLKLIVIDSITHFLSPCFGGKYLDGLGFMGSIAHMFKVICTEHALAVLVTNNTVQSESCDIKAGLGANWKYIPSVSLCLRPVHESKVWKMTTVKSSRNGLHNTCTFRITEAGISD